MIRPQFKILLYIFFAFLLFSARNLYIELFIGSLSLIFLILYPKIRSGIKYILIFLTAIFIGNIFDNSGRVIFSFLFIHVTDLGVYNASIKTLQIFLMIIGAKILILNTGMTELINGLGILCRPLKIIRLPVDDFIEMAHLTITALSGITEEIKEKARLNREKYNMSGVSKGSNILSNNIDFIVEIVLPLLIVTIKTPEKLFIQRVCDPLVRAEDPKG